MSSSLKLLETDQPLVSCYQPSYISCEFRLQLYFSGGVYKNDSLFLHVCPPCVLRDMSFCLSDYAFLFYSHLIALESQHNNEKKQAIY